MTLRAFLVEDSPVIRVNLIAALQEMAPVAVVGSAEGQTQALEWLLDTAHDCDLVVLDLYLREGSGLGVLEALRLQRPDLDCVVLSNYATADMRRRCLTLGATRVFDKSSEIDALVLHCADRHDHLLRATPSLSSTAILPKCVH